MTKSLSFLLIVSSGFIGRVYAQATLSVTPAYSVVTHEKPYGAFVLHNQGTESVEITIHARYGVIASTDSTTTVVLDEAGGIGNLAEYLTFFPDRCILPAGGEQTVRYRIYDAPEGGHIALMHFSMQERGGIMDEQIPAVASGLSIVYNLVAPVIYFQGRGTPDLSARILQSTQKELLLLVENHSTWPFLGGVRVFQGERQLGRAESAVYTKRLVRIPVSEVPKSDPLRLEFDNRYTGLHRSVQHQLVPPYPIQLSRN